MEIPTSLPQSPGLETRDQIQKVARDLETAFLAEVLKSIAPDTSSGSFGGGIGEEQFQSFLFEQQARGLMEQGGLGLKNHFIKSLEGMKS